MFSMSAIPTRTFNGKAIVRRTINRKQNNEPLDRFIGGSSACVVVLAVAVAAAKVEADGVSTAIMFWSSLTRPSDPSQMRRTSDNLKVTSHNIVANICRDQSMSKNTCKLQPNQQFKHTW